MSTENPLVSIIIPTYNRAHLIGETLDSVLAQTYQNWECIVVDDGSTDDTDTLMAEYMAKDSRFRYYHRPKDRLPGGNAARNYGFEQSRGEYIQWFDSDDLMYSYFLKFKIDNLNNNDIILTSGEVMNQTLETRELRFQFKEPFSLFNEMVTYNSEILTPCVLFKKTFLENKVLFNETIARGQESEFFARLFFHNPNINFIILKKVLFQYRINSTSKSNKDENAYLTSRLIFFIDNFERSFILKDEKLIIRFYKKIISTLFDFIKNSMKSEFNIFYIKFRDLIAEYNFRVKNLYLLPVLSKLNFHSEKIRKYFLNQY
ncbi:glycosyltransferase family 2 protein [Marixanthomonas spongiae]|uniref:Glycosyltransferase 2-like domain-containing protein n=1 Tax=Marixanthomonas spongiae TaxID=2174845 RepID=A0A2U0I5S3_9FLAO|nr:glycosyltransferase family 2 protein [Marixanthomonas spongiae]PVW16455.1 hypothetical protein DDV96_04145 [Marixanthomonas spongiae]